MSLKFLLQAAAIIDGLAHRYHNGILLVQWGFIFSRYLCYGIYKLRHVSWFNAAVISISMPEPTQARQV